MFQTAQHSVCLPASGKREKIERENGPFLLRSHPEVMPIIHAYIPSVGTYSHNHTLVAEETEKNVVLVLWTVNYEQ